jgi:dCTP deaminase
MILTGAKIRAEVERGRIVIDPFDAARVEPNSYGFRLGPTLLTYLDAELDARRAPQTLTRHIPDEGMVLEPGRLYLGETAEILGSPAYAATLEGTRSTASMGMWIHFSAPLGHAGAVISWTLEIMVTQPVIVLPYMPIGKIAFWASTGRPDAYHGRYAGSTGARASALSADFCPPTTRERAL